MQVPAEFFCLRCQKCIRDASQLRPHLQECPEANFQRIAYAPPPWQRRAIDINQFRDFSDSSDISPVYSCESRDNVTPQVNPTYPARRLVNRPAPRVSTPAESVHSSELESLLNEALFIPDRREKITLGMGVRAFLAGKPLRRQGLHGILVTNPLWIGGELHGDVRVAHMIRSTRDLLGSSSVR